LPGENLPLFDLLSARPPAGIADTAADYNPFVTALSEAQVLSLRATHTAAYNSSPRYRSLVDQLIEENERRVWLRLREGKPGYAEKNGVSWQAFLRRE